MYISDHIRHAALRCLAAALVVAVTAILGGCIKNDIPYPRIQPNFTSFVVEGQTQAATIDSTDRTVKLVLDETVDIYAVPLTSYTLSCGQPADPAQLSGTLDLSRPLSVTLTLYQDYVWTISATQDIARNFSVQGQIGASVIDLEAHRVVAYVPETKGVTAVKVNSIKLAGSTAVMTPDLNGRTVDFTNPVKVTVSEFGRETVWTIYVEPTQATVTTSSVDAWTCVAWLYGSAQEGSDSGFEYKLQGATEWTKMPSEWVTHDGGSFTGRLIHLQPETNYVARAYSGEDYGEEIEFTTGSNPQLPNGTMDDWWKDGKIWCPWAEGGQQWWDTGNKGATTLGESNTVPTDDTSSGTGKAAMLQTKFVGIGPLGKLAAGNIYAGKFVKVDGTNGILNMGQPFTARPTKLRGYYKYKGGNITNASNGFKDRIGRPDTCSVWCALADWTAPIEIRTNPNNRNLFDPDDPGVIAYGVMYHVEDVNEYTRFEVEFEYKATNRVPRYILVTAAASKLGDYFTGCNTAVMWVDDFELVYDY